jgi:putative ATP-dependent endonuclease of OLD family
MYLSNIKLWNFRKFGTEENFDIEKPNLDLNFTKSLNVLIGENDSGKTAIIDAIKLVLKTHSYEWLKITQEDFFANQDRLRIELEFIDFSDDEAKNFTEWLGWKGEGENVKPYLRLIYDVRKKKDDSSILPSEVRAGVDESGYPLTAEAREYLKVTYLKPLRDAYGELVPRRNSRLSQILLGHEAFKGKEEDHLLVELFRNFNKSVEKYFEGKENNEEESELEDQKGKELKAEIDKFIHSFYSKEKESNLGVIGGNLKNILEKLELTIKDEINPGLGTLNRLFMATELVHLQKKNWNGIRLGLIEELEAHIHPQAQMQIIESLQKEKNIQLILTTHSPNLGSKVKLENLILCSNNYAFPLGKEYTDLDKGDYKFLERFLDTTKANLFFAKGVIFVEGWAEEILMPAIAKKLKSQGIISKDLTEAGISIVNIGNTAFLHYSRIYLRKEEPLLDIPVAIVTDIDIKEYEKKARKDDNGNIIKTSDGKIKYEYIKRDIAIITNESTAQKTDIISKWEKQSVKVFIAPHWTLEYSIYKSDSLKDIFCKILKRIYPRLDMNSCELELANKLLNKTLNKKKTEIAYRLAQAIEYDNTIIIEENDEPIKYLIDAIKYVSND